MELSDIYCRTETLSLNVENCSAFMSYTYSVTRPSEENCKENLLFDVLQIDDLIRLVKRPEQIKTCISNDFAFYGTGWQSWSYGGELDKGVYQKEYIPIVPQWKHYVNFPGTKPRALLHQKLLKGDFIIYFRWGSTYIVVASTGNTSPAYFEAKPKTANDFCEDARNKVLPPVCFYVDRTARTVHCVSCCEGKAWRAGEKLAQLTVFAAYDFFSLKEGITALFGDTDSPQMRKLAFLDCSYGSDVQKIYTAGWESWYNHYVNINEKIIREDLENLLQTPNLINVESLQKGKPAVFLVDDGWERMLGEWEPEMGKFPSGMKVIASSITEKGCIPGLWLAPFILDIRSPVAKEHPDWLLHGKKGKPIQAGFNPLWGAAYGKQQPGFPHSFYCFDLSNDDVVDYLACLMDKVINDWGFRYIKLDFLYAGMISASFKNSGAAYQWYDRALKIITNISCNRKNEPVAYLGCGIPFEASFNMLPLSRIGPDAKEVWEVNYLKRANFAARASSYANLKSTLGHSFWNRSVFINDPDVVFMRYDNISLNDTEKELIALVNFMFSSQIVLSDDPGKFSRSTEGFFTNHIQNLYKIFGLYDWAVQVVDDDIYCIYSRDFHFIGFANLADRPVLLTERQIHEELSVGKNIDPALYEPLVLHARKTKNGYIAEKHSISILELKQS